MINIRCPHCHAVLTAEEDRAGEYKRCPACQRPIYIPDVSRLPAAQRQELIRPEEIPDVSPAQTGLTLRGISLVQRFSNLRIVSRVALVLAVLVLPLGSLVTYELVHHHLETTKPPPPPTPTPIPAQGLLRPAADAAVLALMQATEWKARQARLESLAALGPDAADSVLAALKDRHVMDKFGHRLDLSAVQEGDLLAVLLAWSKEHRLPDSAMAAAPSLLRQPATCLTAAFLLAYQGDKAAGPILGAELIGLVKRIALVQNRIKEGLEPNQREAELLLAADKQRLEDVRFALVRLGPEGWPALLSPFWSTWPWIGNYQGEFYLAELDQIRTNPFSQTARLQAKLNDLVKTASADVALPAATYLARIEGPRYDRNRQLAAGLVRFLKEREKLTVQRTVWVISRLVNREFDKFDADQLPLQASEEAIQACRAWAAESLGISPSPPGRRP